MTSRMATMRRALRAIEGVLAELPLAPEVLEARIDEALGSVGAAADEVGDLQAFARRANERAAVLGVPDAVLPLPASGADAPDFPDAPDIQASALVPVADWLRDHLTPVPPPLSVEEGLADLRETLVCETASRLGDHLEGLRDALSPVPAPRDADWAGSALESLGVDQDVVRSWARPSRAPGWLWARIRRDMEEARTAVRARRVPVALAAATVVLSASLAVVLLHGRGAGEEVGPQITFFRVDRPLSDQYAPAALLQRLRDGR
jgi:hypothetical protein